MLDTIAECGQEVSPYLDAWPVHVGEPAVRQLAVLVSDLLVSSQQDNGFWCEVNEWLSSPIPADVLAAEVSATADPDVARELSDAFEHMMLWQQSLTASTTARTESSPA
ncbi:MAG TPA: hypothetical protein VFX61_23635 [Micromonosporaceae bacterium]|nr:hypothetical protein [Micromonosporaceae bacterium]